MRRPAFVLVLALLALLALAYPLQQLVTGAYVLYVNATEETTYLQYDFSRAAQAISRPGQFLVSLLHQVGLSGGRINLLLDSIALVGFPLVGRALFLRLGWQEPSANAGALLLLTLPLALLTANPVVRALYEWTLHSGMIYWLSMPEAFHSPLVRSPEPAFSLLLLAGGTWVGLRLKAFWPVYVVLPFMYPFVSIPAAFVAFACQLRARRSRWSAAVALGISALIVASAIGGYYAFIVSDKVRLILVASHLPIVSLTGMLALTSYAFARQAIAPEHRFFVLAVACSPLFAANHQLVSGYVAQPSNFEQYAGTLAVAVVLAFALVDRPRLMRAAIGLGAAFFCYASYSTFRTNQLQDARLPLTPALVQALKGDAANVVLDDVSISSRLSLLHARQNSPVLSAEKIYLPLISDYKPNYPCVKRQVLADHPEHPAFKSIFRQLDHGYQYAGQDLLVLHLGRKSSFRKLMDVRPEACERFERLPLRYYFVP